MATIPRIIFQTWESREVPEVWRAAQRSVIDMHPAWKYVLLTADDRVRIIRAHFPQLLPRFLGFRHNVQRADMIRCAVLYLYGGVYLDLDYVAIRPFDGIRLEDGKEVGIAVSSNAKFRLSNSFMVSTPRSTFWLQCLAAMDKPRPFWAITQHLEVFASTGPFVVNRVARRNSPVVQRLTHASVPCSICEHGRCVHDPAYFVMPVAGGSWFAWDGIVLVWLFCHWVWVATAALALLVLLMFTLRG